MSQNTKEWIKLIALIFGTGAAVIVTSVAGGMKTWLAVLMGLGVAGTNVFHAMSEKPGEKSPDGQPQNKEPNP